MKTLKIVVFSIYGLWAVLSIVLWACGVAGALVGLSFLWTPALLLYIILLFITIGAAIGEVLQKPVEPSCENCVYKSMHTITGACIGEKDGQIFGSVCRHYQQSPRKML